MGSINTETNNLLRKILAKLEILAKQDEIRQIETFKKMTFLFDRRTSKSNWTSFNPVRLNNMRLFGYFYSSAPSPVITDEGWYPLSLDEDGKLKII